MQPEQVTSFAADRLGDVEHDGPGAVAMHFHPRQIRHVYCLSQEHWVLVRMLVTEERQRKQNHGGVLLQALGCEHGSWCGAAGCTVPLMGTSVVGPPGAPRVHPSQLLRDL